MSAVTDITGLVALESQAPVEAPVVETEKPTGLPASDLPANKEKTAETKVEETKADEGKTGTQAGEKTESKIVKAGDPKATATKIHETLKAFAAERPTPEGKAKLIEINEAVGALTKQLLEAHATAKDVAEVVKASEELETLVSNTDQLLYDSADPAKAAELVQNIWDDVQENATPEAFTGFAVSALNKLKAAAPADYYKHVVLPSYHHALETTGMVDAVRSLIGAYNKDDKASLREGIAALAKHLEEVSGKATEYTKTQEAAKASKEQETYTSSVRSECETLLNKGLGKALSPILKGTELGTYGRDVQLTVAKEMRQEFFKRIQENKPYWDALNAAYAKRDTARIKQLYSAKVNNLADEVTKTVIDRMYPNGLEKRSAKDKAAAAVKGEYVDFAEGKFLRVKSKPSDLDMTVRKADTMLIAGRGVRKDGTKVCWRKN
jgi:hypothetical protein